MTSDSVLEEEQVHIESTLLTGHNISKQSSLIFIYPWLLGFQVKDAREKLGQKDARFKIRGRGGAGGVQDARQMINSRKQGQNPLGVPVQTTQNAAGPYKLQTLVPQIQIHTNSVAGANSRQFTPTIPLLSGRGGATPQLVSSKRILDARDRLSLKRSVGGTQQSAAAPPLKITKTIQVCFSASQV